MQFTGYTYIRLKHRKRDKIIQSIKFTVRTFILF